MIKFKYFLISIECREYGRNIKRPIYSWTTTSDQERTYDSCPFASTYSNQALISEGTRSLEKELPHMASIGYSFDTDQDEEEDVNNIQWRCGGSLITDFFVISAAHCNNKKAPKYLLFGVLNNKKESPHRVVRGIKTIINHPDYDHKTKNNDICLYKSDAAVPFNDYIRPICLPVKNYDLIQYIPIASGFGKTHYTRLSDVLFKVNLNHLDPLNCQIDEMDRSKICAGSLNSSADTCTGDSGGPLQIRHPDEENNYCMYVIVGITSNGYFCVPRTRNVRTASVYTRVWYYLNWIECNVWKTNC